MQAGASTALCSRASRASAVAGSQTWDVRRAGETGALCQGQGLPAGVPALHLGLEEPPLSLTIPSTAPFWGILFRCPNGRYALHPPCAFTAASDVVLLGDPFPPGTGFLREGCAQQPAQRREAKGSLTAEAAPWAQRGPALAARCPQRRPGGRCLWLCFPAVFLIRAIDS